MQALVALAGRFHALAERRENDALEATEAVALRSTDVKWLGADRPVGLPSVEALQMAADAMSRHYVLPETMRHPAIQSATRSLAYTLMAYGLAQTQPDPAAAQSARAAAEQRGTRRPVVGHRSPHPGGG